MKYYISPFTVKHVQLRRMGICFFGVVCCGSDKGLSCRVLRRISFLFWYFFILTPFRIPSKTSNNLTTKTTDAKNYFPGALTRIWRPLSCHLYQLKNIDQPRAILPWAVTCACLISNTLPWQHCQPVNSAFHRQCIQYNQPSQGESMTTACPKAETSASIARHPNSVC